MSDAIEPGGERLAAADDIGAEDELDRSLRPRRMGDFIGQEGVKQQLSIFLEAARQRGEALDHVLLAGPPGLGKTSLAGIVAAEMGVGFHVTSGPVLERKGDLAAVLTALDPHDVLFIDEIHRLSRVVEEVLYPAMEDFQLDVVLGQGPSARTLRLDLPRFTLVGATTRTGLLTTPLRGALRGLPPARLLRRRRSRGHRPPLGPAARRGDRRRTAPSRWPSARAERRASPTGCCGGCATWPRCAATPRVDREVAEEALELLEVDALGLEELDRQILRRLAETFEGRPVGPRARWPTAWGRRPTRSRTSTSPTCSRRACSSARPGAAWPRRAPTATWARPAGRRGAARAVLIRGGGVDSAG